MNRYLISSAFWVGFLLTACSEHSGPVGMSPAEINQAVNECHSYRLSVVILEALDGRTIGISCRPIKE